jgi:hypothetical protein
MLYQRPIFPLGQIYNNPPASQVRRFRQLSRIYHSANVSWWDWQEARPGGWRSISVPVGVLSGYVPYSGYATLSNGAAGDVVVWAQEHLVSAGQQITIDGRFGRQTQAAVQAFQTEHALPVTGIVDQLTWEALLRYAPTHVKWVMHRHHLTATMAAAGIRPVPRSASLRSRRYEIPRSLGAGRPRS